MANGDAGIEYEFMGNPECGICGALAGTTDSEPIAPPHENCQCTNEARCTNALSVAGSSSRYGPGGSCFVFHAEITVTCWDGTEIGESLDIDFGCTGADQDEGFLDELYDRAGDAAGGLEDGCPECESPNVA
jgi:hypothetical protein